jgi:hypothetical protein
MRLMEKNGSLVRTLTRAELDQLERFHAGSLTSFHLLSANRALLKIRSDGHWLACECRTDQLPVMHVRLDSSSGIVTVVNNPETHDHAAGCEFAKDERESGSSRAHAERLAIMLPPDSPLKLIGQFRSVSEGDAVERTRNPGADGPVQREQHRQVSMLMTLIEASGLNSYSAEGKQTLTQQFAELRKVAGRYALVERVPANNYLETRIDMKHMLMLKSRLVESTAFQEKRRYGLMLDCIIGTKGRKLLTFDKPEGFDFKGQNLLWGGTKTEGPVLALAIYSPSTPGTNFYDLINVASVPVLSRGHLFPVYRAEEREALSEMVSIINWMATKGVKVVMRRPMIGSFTMDELVLTGANDRVLSVSLAATPSGPEPTSDTFKRLSDFKSVQTFSKYVMGFFMNNKK